MRILIISQYFPPDIAGSSTRAYNVVKGLQNNDYDIVVLTAFPHYPTGNIPKQYKGKAVNIEKRDNIKIVRVWVPSLPHNSILNRLVMNISFLFSSLFAIFFVGKIDVIFAANPNLFVFFPALLYSFFNFSPIIRNVDDLWPEVFYDMGLVKSKIITKILDFSAWLSYSMPVFITPISEGYKKKIINKYNIDKKKIKVIEVGIDVKNYYIKKQDNNNEFIVMYSGILGPAYDFMTVMRAAVLLEQHQNIIIYIRGTGESEESIKSMIQHFSLDNVILDTTIVPINKMVEILNTANVFILPLKNIEAVDEGLPTKIFEYQIMSKPILCLSEGESARYIKSTNSGLVMEPGDYKSLADNIIKIYNNKKLFDYLGVNGNKYVSENLSIENIGDKMHTLISKISL